MVGRKQIRWKYFVAATLSLVALILGASASLLSPTAYAATSFEWTSATQIKAVDVPGTTPNDMTFTCTNGGSPGQYNCISDQPGLCKAKLIINGNALEGLLKRSVDTKQGYCIDGAANTVAITDPGSFSPTELEGGGTGSGGGSGGAGTETDPDLECGQINKLNWILCPFIKIINLTVNSLDKLIIKMLTVDQVKIFDSTQQPGMAYHAAWETFRGFALALLVIGGLAMVIAQALGFESLDAYTMKKVLPRLLVAIIGIALSWEIMEFLVVATNNLGQGVRSVILYPFREFGPAGQLGEGAAGGAIAVALLSSKAVLALGFGGLLSLVGTALLALGVAFLVLVVRQLVIVVLILLAPIAIAAYILPNTQGIWKIWYESFTKALMMFPIIIAFLTVGRVFAITATSGSVTDGAAIGQLIGVAAYIMPYFLIPKTFSLAGGALRVLGGAVNDRSRGGFDRLKKGRAIRTEDRRKRMDSGTLYRPTNALARGFNATSAAAAIAPKAGLNPYQMKSRYNEVKSARDLAAIEDVRKNPHFALGSQDDRVLRAAQHGKGAAGIRDYLRDVEEIKDEKVIEDLAGSALAMQSSGSKGAVQAAIALQRFATGTGYTKKDDKGQEYFDYDDAFNTIRSASGNDRALAGTLLGQAKGTAAGAGQLAFGGASYGKLNDGLTESFAGRKVARGGAVASTIALDAYDSTDAMTAARARGVHLQTMAEAATGRINAIDDKTATNVKPGELGQRAAQLESWSQTTGMYGAPNRQTIVNNQVPMAEGAINRLREAVTPRPAPAPPAPVISPIITVGKNWNPSQPIPQPPQPVQAPPTPGPAPSPTPSGPPLSPADLVQFARNSRGGMPRPGDERTIEAMRPPEPPK